MHTNTSDSVIRVEVFHKCREIKKKMFTFCAYDSKSREKLQNLDTPLIVTVI